MGERDWKRRGGITPDQAQDAREAGLTQTARTAYEESRKGNPNAAVDYWLFDAATAVARELQIANNAVAAARYAVAAAREAGDSDLVDAAANANPESTAARGKT